MKRIFTAIFVVCTIVLINSCSTAKNMSLTSYVEEGTGVSINKDKAYDMAVNNALLKITKAHGIKVKVNENQTYTDTESSRGRNSEEFNYESKASTSAVAQMVDYRVVKKRYTKSRFSKKFTCSVVVSVPSDNVD